MRSMRVNDPALGCAREEVAVLDDLVGVGLYTPAEAGRLLRIQPQKISRWLRGHDAKGKHYDPLWKSEVHLDDGTPFLGFLDLMETRVVDAFIKQGVSSQRMRTAIKLAQEVMNECHPLATNRFRTDGRDVFLQVIEQDEDGQDREKLLSLFNRQYAFKEVLDPVLRTVDFGDDGHAALWWPQGRKARIMVDPTRSFGAPIEGESFIQTAVLASEAEFLGVDVTANLYRVSKGAVKRAVDFERSLAA